jgi:hypothetical protein
MNVFVAADLVALHMNDLQLGMRAKRELERMGEGDEARAGEIRRVEDSDQRLSR